MMPQPINDHRKT